MTINLNQKIRKYRREPYFEGRAYHRIYRYGEMGGEAVNMNIYKFVEKNINKRPLNSFRCSRRMISAYCVTRKVCGGCLYARLLCLEFTPLYNCVTLSDAKQWIESYESR